MHGSLDKIDTRLLEEVQTNAGRSAAEIGEAVGLSQAACWRRLQRLRDDGFITKTVSLIDPEKVGCGTTILAHVKLSAHGRANLDDFSRKIQSLPNVLECFVLLGDTDFFLKIAVQDIYEYETFFFQRLSKLEGVAEVRSMVALSKIKNEIRVPVRVSS